MSGRRNSIRKVALALALAAGISIATAMLGDRWGAFWSEHGPDAQGETADLNRLPTFSLRDLDGREVQSADWAGKPLVLLYWASWCPSCVAELNRLSAAQESLKGRGLQAIAIAVDRAEDARSFAAENPVAMPILIATPESVELARQLGDLVQSVPFTAIFDARGRRTFSWTGELGDEELRTQLGRALGDKPETAAAETSEPRS